MAGDETQGASPTESAYTERPVFRPAQREPLKELVVMAAANAGAGFTQAFSVGASGARTAVNESMGARTQVAGLFAALSVTLVLLFLTGPVQYLPHAVLGAVLVSAGLRIVDLPAWRALAAIDRVEVAIAAVTVGCVVAFGVLQALVVAVGLSVIDIVRRSARPYDAVLGFVSNVNGWAGATSPCSRRRA